MNQLEKVIELTGKPSPEDIKASGSQYAERDARVDRARAEARAEPRRVRAGGAAFITRRCLKFNPSAGHGGASGSEDPFVGEFHKSEEEEPDFPGGPVKITVDDNISSRTTGTNSLYADPAGKGGEPTAKARAAKGRSGARARGAAGAAQQEGAAPAPGSPPPAWMSGPAPKRVLRTRGGSAGRRRPRRPRAWSSTPRV